LPGVSCVRIVIVEIHSSGQAGHCDTGPVCSEGSVPTFTSSNLPDSVQTDDLDAILCRVSDEGDSAYVHPPQIQTLGILLQPTTLLVVFLDRPDGTLAPPPLPDAPNPPPPPDANSSSSCRCSPSATPSGLLLQRQQRKWIRATQENCRVSEGATLISGTTIRQMLHIG
jgi:hypothetical protein